MTPTYTTAEVLAMLPSLDIEEIQILSELVGEELKRYTLLDAKKISFEINCHAARLSAKLLRVYLYGK